MTVGEKHVIQSFRGGKDYVLYPGLLDAAHKAGLMSIETTLLQIPDADNGGRAVVKATATLHEFYDNDVGRGTLTKTFDGIGDADPDNVGRTIKPHLIRMAETRAKARALRDAVNAEGAVDETEGEPIEAETESEEPAPNVDEIAHVERGGAVRQILPTNKAGHSPATEGQLEALRNLATERAGEKGVEKLERRIKEKLEDLTVAEADKLIFSLAPD